MKQLDRDERMLLLQFACAFAWADEQIQPEERGYIKRLVRRLDLDDEERTRVAAWLDAPPPALDPSSVPQDHRVLFLRALESVIAVDGEVTDEERAQLLHFARLAR